VTIEQKNNWILHYKNQHKKLMEKYLNHIKFGKNTCCSLKAAFYVNWFINVLCKHCLPQPNRCVAQIGFGLTEPNEVIFSVVNSNVPDGINITINFTDISPIELRYNTLAQGLGSSDAYPNLTSVIRYPGDPKISPNLSNFEVILEIEYDAINCNNQGMSINLTPPDAFFDRVFLGTAECNCFKSERDIQNCFSDAELCSIKKNIDKLIHTC
jgi:hypothetical protein